VFWPYFKIWLNTGIFLLAKIDLPAYHHPLYDKLLPDWKMEEFQEKTEAGAKRIEVLWINLVAARKKF
jgi:hypothetical protein